MSDAGDILDALTTDVEAAVADVTVVVDPTKFTGLTTDDLPYCILTHEPYEAEQIEYAQEQRTWTVKGHIALVHPWGREAMNIALEAIRDVVMADPTLDSSVDRSIFAPGEVSSNPDDERVFGDFKVTAEKVA